VLRVRFVRDRFVDRATHSPVNRWESHLFHPQLQHDWKEGPVNAVRERELALFGPPPRGLARGWLAAALALVGALVLSWAGLG
jgi:hypothetical protein